MKEYIIQNYVIRKDLNYIEIFYIEYILRNKVFIFQKISTLRIILHIFTYSCKKDDFTDKKSIESSNILKF